MNTPLLISLMLNIVLYIIIASFVYKKSVKDYPDEEPLPADQAEGYRKFCIFMAIIWPFSVGYMIFTENVD